MNMRSVIGWFVVAALAALTGCADGAGVEPCTAGEYSMPGSENDPCPQDGCPGNFAMCNDDGMWAPCTCPGGAGGTGGASPCGNGALDTGEQCDGANLNGQSCATFMTGSTGMLLCDPTTCMYDDSMCMTGSGGVGGTGI